MRSIDIYQALAQQSETAFLTFAATQSHRRDTQSLRACIEVIHQIGHTVSLLDNSFEIAVTLAAPHSDLHSMAGLYVDARVSFARIFLQAVLPPSNPNECPTDRSHQRYKKYKTTMTEDGLSLLHQVIALGAPGTDSRAFSSPEKRNCFLSLMLFNAASLTDDALIFDMLMAAGATPEHKMLSRHPVVKIDALTVFEEAWMHKNLGIASRLCSHIDPKVMTESIHGMVHGDGDFMPHHPNDTGAQGFHKNIFTRVLCLALQEKRYTGVHALVNAICAKLDQDSTPGQSDENLSRQFRTLLLSSYLRTCVENWRCPWEYEALDAISCSVDLGPNFEVIARDNKQWVNFMEGQTNQDLSLTKTRWGCHKNHGSRVLNFSEPLADLVYQALRTHCVPLLEMLKPALKDVITACVPGIGIQTVIDPGMTEDAFVCNPLYYKATLELLMGLGHSVSSSLRGFEGNGNALHVVAGLGEQGIKLKLSALLALGANRNFENSHGKTPFDSIKNKDARCAWMNIQRSFGARDMALSILNEIDEMMLMVPKQISLSFSSFGLPSPSHYFLAMNSLTH